MAANVANIQLTVMQLPQVAHDQMPGLLQAELANAQAPALIRQQDERAAEMVQELEQPVGNKVGDALTGSGPRYQAGAQGRRRPDGGAASQNTPHPLGVGSLIDIRV
ncbi:MAG: hypothetical protein KGJ86_09550 [Chloroflexota bacterium]|nr:hypothetical protein [Chloroflexota bacterium]